MATAETNPFYIKAVAQGPNAFATFVQGYLGMRVPIAMEWMRARMKAADPTARLAAVADLARTAGALRERYAQVGADLARTDASRDVALMGLNGEAVRMFGIGVQAESADRASANQLEGDRIAAQALRDTTAQRVGADLQIAGLESADSWRDSVAPSAATRDALSTANAAIGRARDELLALKTTDPSGWENSPQAKESLRTLALQVDGAMMLARANGATAGQLRGLGNSVEATLGLELVEGIGDKLRSTVSPKLQPLAKEDPPLTMPGESAPVEVRSGGVRRQMSWSEVQDMVGTLPTTSTSTSTGTRTTTRASGEPTAGAAPRATVDTDPLLKSADEYDKLARELMAEDPLADLGGFFDPIPGARPPREPVVAAPVRKTPEERKAERERRKAKRKGPDAEALMATP